MINNQHKPPSELWLLRDAKDKPEETRLSDTERQLMIKPAGGFEKYQMQDKRLRYFTKVIEKSTQLWQYFSQSDNNNSRPLHITLAEQGLIPMASKKQHRNSDEKPVVRCVYCTTILEIPEELLEDLLTMHLHESRNQTGQPCKFARYYAKNNALSLQASLPSCSNDGESVRTVTRKQPEKERAFLPQPSVTPVDSSLSAESEGACAISQPPQSYKQSEDGFQKKDNVDSLHQPDPTVKGIITKGYFKYFRYLHHYSSNEIKRLVEPLIQANITRDEALALKQFLKKLPVKPVVGMQLTTILSALSFDEDNALAHQLCAQALAASNEGSCSDRSLVTLYSMLVAAFTVQIFSDSVVGRFDWEKLLVELKKLYHETVFHELFTSFKYKKKIFSTTTPLDKKIATSSESIAFFLEFRKVLESVCVFTFPLLSPEYAHFFTGRSYKLYEFQDDFVKEIKSKEGFKLFLNDFIINENFRSLVFDNDENYASIISGIKAKAYSDLENLENAVTEKSDASYMNAAYRLMNKKIEQEHKLLEGLVFARMEELWETIESKTVKEKFEEGLSMKQIRKKYTKQYSK